MVTPAARSGRAGRPAHSLVELMVALMVLATSLAAIAAAGLHAVSATDRAIRVQDAAARAAAALDSLATVRTPPAGGSRHEGDLLLEWTVDGAGTVAHVVVRAVDPLTGRPLLELAGAWAAPPPPAPAGVADSAAPAEALQ